MATEFKATATAQSDLREALFAVSKLVEEGAIVASPDGLLLRAMDESRCAMVSLEVPSSYFYREVESKKKDKESGGWRETEKVPAYECPSPVTMGIQIELLNRVLKRFSSSYCSNLQFEKKGSLLIIAEVADGIHDDLLDNSKSFELPLLDIEPEQHAESKLKWSVKFRTGYSAIRIGEALQDAKAIGATQVRINAIREAETKEQPHPEHTVIVSAQGEFGKIQSTLRSNEVEFSGSTQQTVATYSLAYLEKMQLKDAELRFATDMPLQVISKIGYDDSRRIMLRYLLAPRMAFEDEEKPAVTIEPIKEAA
jgi:hypothetical protein